MAHAIVILKHPDLNIKAEAPVGFSWTCLFFGFLLFAYRGDWMLSFICFILTCLMGPIPNVILCWTYNEWYLNRLLKKGYDILDVKELD